MLVQISLVLRLRQFVCAAVWSLGLFLACRADSTLAATPAFSISEQHANLVGRSVAAVLKELTARDRQFIYSSQLLPNTVRVLQTPTAGDALALAREILAPHRLMLSQVAPGVYAVVAASSDSATVAMRGHIVDARDDSPIESVQLELQPGNRHTETDANGDFEFSALPPERYRLHISRAGFEPREFALTPHDPSAAFDIRLQASRYVLEGTLVTASRFPFGVKATENSLNLAGESLSAQSSLGEDPIRALARLPGITQNGVIGELNIRGGATNEVLILFDGFPLRQAFHMPGYRSLLSIFDPGAVSEVNVYTGAMPARYGGRMSGVLDIESIDALSDPRHSFGLGFLSGRARIGESIGQRSDGLVAARYGAFGYLSDVIEPATGHPSYSDALNRVHMRLGEATDLSINALLSRDALNIHRDGLNESGEIDSEAAYVWLRSLTRWDNGSTSSFILGRTYLQQSRSGDLESPQIASGNLNEDRRSEIWDARANATLPVNMQHILEFGGEWSHGIANYLYDKELQFAPLVEQRFPQLGLHTQTSTLAPRREQSAAFISDRWSMSSRFSSQIGLRVNHFEAADAESHTEWDPRVALIYTLSGTTELRAAWGRVHQFVDVSEIAVEDAIDVNSAPQRTDYAVLSYEHKIRDSIMLRVEAFRKEQTNVLPRFQNFVNSASILPELSFDRIFIAPRSADEHGAEVYIQQSSDPWSWRLAYSWSDAEERVGNFEVPRDWDQRNVATLGLEWTQGPWQLSSAAIVRSGRPTTRIVNGPNGSILVGLRNGDRLGTYFGIDLRGAWRKELGRGIFSAAVQVSNALNHRSECCSSLSVRANANGDPYLYITNGKSSPLIPWASVAWDF